MKTETINQIWAFSSSSTDTVYQTIQWGNGALSCDCPGWTRRVAIDGSRSCKHTRSVELGTANLLCIATNPPETIKIAAARDRAHAINAKYAKQPKAKPAKPSMVRAIELEDPE